MRRAVALALALVLLACAPIVQDQRAPGVTLTRAPADGFTVYRVDTRQPLERLFLRFIGSDLRANAPECQPLDGALECVIGAVESFYELPLAGDVQNDWNLPAGIACTSDACHPLFLTR